MAKGESGMGMKKHARSGCRRGNTKSPKFRHGMKREAEKNEVKDQSRIKDPKGKPSEVFNNEGR